MIGYREPVGGDLRGNKLKRGSQIATLDLLIGCISETVQGRRQLV